METYMVDAWLSFFSYFPFHFISFFTTTPVSTPCGICHWTPTIFFFIIAIIPFPHRLVEGPRGPFFSFISLWSGDTRLMFFFFLLIPKDTRDGMGLLRNCRDK